MLPVMYTNPVYSIQHIKAVYNSCRVIKPCRKWLNEHKICSAQRKHKGEHEWTSWIPWELEIRINSCTNWWGGHSASPVQCANLDIWTWRAHLMEAVKITELYSSSVATVTAPAGDLCRQKITHGISMYTPPSTIACPLQGCLGSLVQLLLAEKQDTSSTVGLLEFWSHQIT